MINTVKDYVKLSEQYDKMLAERNSLIDDIVLLRANNKRLERENKEIKQWHQMHKECADAVYEKKVEYESLLSEISQHIGNKPSSSTYKYFRAKLDGVGIKEGE